jgi:hypothetical protein
VAASRGDGSGRVVAGLISGSLAMISVNENQSMVATSSIRTFSLTLSKQDRLVC